MDLYGRKVKRVLADWFYTTENGEEYVAYEVGKTAVSAIEYHNPMGEGDRHYCDIRYDDGSIIRKFNINSVEFEP